MSTWKHIGHVSATLLPAILAGCCDMSGTHKQRAALVIVDEPLYVAKAEPAPPQVEPAAGDKVFHQTYLKR
jgi:hypothetical protein